MAVRSSEAGASNDSGSQKCIHFGTGQESNRCARVSFARNGQYLLNLVGLRRKLEGTKAKEGADRRQSKIAATRCQAADALQFFQESNDQ
jgi:hypothetical protein